MPVETIWMEGFFGALLSALAWLAAWGALRTLKSKAGGWVAPLMRIVWPVLILALTSILEQILVLLGSWDHWLLATVTHRLAWKWFWVAVAGIYMLEESALWFYEWRKRPFPVPALLRNILRALLLTGVVFGILRFVLHINISPLLASTALVTAVVGFALQGVLGNLMAGLSLHITSSLMPGDWVAVNDVEGCVVSTNWRETVLRTRGGHRMVIPNSKVAEATLNNMSRPDDMRRHTLSVGASYADAPGDVIEAMHAAAHGVPDVLDDPPPQAFVTQFLDFGVNYQMYFWSRHYYRRPQIEGEVARRIWYQFKRRGIEIPFPMSDKLLNDFMEVVRTQRRLIPEDEEMGQRVALLQASDFVTRLLVDDAGKPLLTSEDLRGPVALMRRQRFTPGEVLFRQDDVSAACYVVLKGRMRITVSAPDGRVAFETESGPGALLGEMGLLTGARRTATVRVMEESEVLEIPTQAFTRILATRPEIPSILAKLVEARWRENTAAQDSLRQAGLAPVVVEREGLFHRFLKMLGR